MLGKKEKLVSFWTLDLILTYGEKRLAVGGRLRTIWKMVQDIQGDGILFLGTD
jgi:hypothetical protein